MIRPNIEGRLAAFRHRLAQQATDTFMVLIGENRRYLSGFTGEDGQFDETAGVLFITGSRCLLATDPRYDLQASREAPLYTIECYEKGLVPASPYILRKLEPTRLGFESARLSVSQFDKITGEITAQGLSVELEPVEDAVEDLRIIKEKVEVDATRQALALAEKVFRSVVGQLTEGMTEQAVAWAMDKGLREAGAETLAFPTIVAFGANSALPHAIPGDRPLKRGEPILFDWGARLHGYCSDTSRTLVMGEPGERFQKVHQTVLDAQQKAIAAIKPGMHSKAVDAVARKHIDQAGFAGKFGHGLGHGTGLAIHEAPRLSPIRDTVLEAGMLVTVEPGIYLPEWGGVRMENQVVVTDDGAEVLNSLGTSYSIDDY